MTVGLWSLEEDKALCRMRDDGCAYADIGEFLGRTEEAVRSRVRVLIRMGKRDPRRRDDCPLASRNGPPWTEAEVAILMAHAGQAPRKVHPLLPGRTRSSVSAKMLNLGIAPSAYRNKPRPARPTVVYPEDLERPVGVPFTTKSGLQAIVLKHGTPPVPFVPSLYGPLPSSLQSAGPPPV